MSLSRRYLRVVLQGWRGGGGQQRRDFSWQPRAWSKWQPSWIGAVVTSASVVYLGYQLFHPNRYVYALKSRTKKDDEVKSIKLTSRERRFLRFASVEFDGQLYMTPQDFLESVVEAEPRPRLKRKALTKEDLKNIKEHTPALQKGSPQLWRNLRDKGVISYTEYLFLLSILTKPQTGFRIAFNMFDTDGNEKVDKTEFLVLEKIFSMAWKDKRGLLNPEEEKTGDEAEEQENTASAKATEALISEMLVDDDRGLQRRHMVDTTLLVHFFGPKGNREIKYEDFRKFMEDLQTEVQELEFHEFSKGLDFISQVDFAKILLRYTYLQSEEYELYLDRLVDRIKLEQGITFEEFRAFCQFLNNLDDFNVAMKMYTLADRPISQDEFRRAVRICTGTDLSPHVVETVFQIFDEDDDGHLSHREFIGVMKDRLHRGFKLYTKNEGWEAFKQCIRQEMKTQ
ncbi:calcium uptake protein 3, mitochondrial isoform X3 [Folsomia candida]|uniref:Calcium uptake protein 3, mitochondrial n=1 Tax=Folsomia candida TaxID=158441 RepID=A0A226E5W6_FOLCA|nr:calcium uptake protein 3, mitochondrial isoform X3 [Folsomia candida]OXA53052.1 Calcium uptake protein 3, mitochondrial [Folsomia candida]